MMGPQGGPPGGMGPMGGMGMGLPGNMHPSEMPPAIMIDPFMQQVQIDEGQFPMFLMQNIQLLEPIDKSHAGKQLSHIARNIFFASAAGIFLNVQIKKVAALNFFQWPKILRVGFRIPLFFLPFGLIINNSMDKMEELAKVNRKYFIRFKKYQRTGDVKYLDPNNIHFKEFTQKMNRDVIRID